MMILVKMDGDFVSEEMVRSLIVSAHLRHPKGRCRELDRMEHLLDALTVLGAGDECYETGLHDLFENVWTFLADEHDGN